MPEPAPSEATSKRAGAGPRINPAAVFALVLLAGIWSWWAWREGAYFPAVFLPGLIVLSIGAAVFFGFAGARPNLRRSRSLQIALVSLTALACWTLLSALWSPAPDIAVGDAQRAFVFLLAFTIALVCCQLLGPRMGLSLLPLALAGGLAGGITIFALATGDIPRDLLEVDGTLDYPLGYRNANAAFYAISMFCGLGLASDPERGWWLRGLALGSASVCIAMIVLCQSRGSMIAIGIAIAVFLLAAPVRLRALSWLVLAALPALAVIGPTASLYDAAGADGIRNVADEMHRAGIAAALAGAGAVVLGALVALAGTRVPGPGTDNPRHNRIIAAAFAVLLVAAVVGFAAVANPSTWIGDRLDEFRSGTPDLSEQTTRFGFNAGSNRKDLWTVALEDFSEDPVLGAGAGGFQYVYTREREVGHQDAHDAHSVELELLSELGLPGLALLVVALAASVLVIIRARRRGPAAAALAAVALASGSYWLIHASVDWFWTYPALTAPVFGLLGAACGAAVSEPGPQGSARSRYLAIAALAGLALSAVPFFLSDRYVDRAGDVWQQDLERAYDDLELAERLNPLSDWPLLIEGEIARRAGDRERAITAFADAVAKRPEEWAGRYRLAQLSAESDPELARKQARLMLERNPLDTDVQSLARRLGVTAGTGP